MRSDYQDWLALRAPPDFWPPAGVAARFSFRIPANCSVNVIEAHWY